MNIEGLSEATLEKFLNLGYLQTFHDIYHLDQHREEIIRLEGFGEKSFDRLWNAIQASRSTTFVRYLVSMDIPMVGRTKSRVLDTVFSGSLNAFQAAATDDYDFTQLEDFGATLNQNIHDWFADEENLMLWDTLQNEFTFEERKEENTMAKNTEFAGKTIVATGKLENLPALRSMIRSWRLVPNRAACDRQNGLSHLRRKAGSKLAEGQVFRHNHSVRSRVSG